MHIKTIYTVTRTDSQGNDWTVGRCDTEEELQKLIAMQKNSNPLTNITIEVTKETTIVIIETIQEFEVEAVAPSVDSVIEEIISASEGTREFYYPESFEYLTADQQATVIDSATEALDYCDHCGHLQDAPSMNFDEDTGSSLCDSCYDAELEAREEEEEENYD
jgi:hypothetical protein